MEDFPEKNTSDASRNLSQKSVSSTSRKLGEKSSFRRLVAPTKVEDEKENIIMEAIQLHKSDPKTCFFEIWGLIMLIAMGTDLIYFILMILKCARFCTSHFSACASLPRNHSNLIARNSVCRFCDAISNRFHATTFDDNVYRMVGRQGYWILQRVLP